MKTIFVIGGIGSGKSTVTRYFAEHGVPTLDLDLVGHRVLTLDAAKKPLIQNFGEDIIGADGQIDRKMLASKAFASPAKTTLLTDITAPLIIEQMNCWIGEQSREGNPFAIVEVSAFDGPKGRYGHLASSIIAVTAPVEVRVDRAMKRGFDGADVFRRISRQPTDDERRLWAQHVITNDGSEEELRQKLNLLLKELCA